MRTPTSVAWRPPHPLDSHLRDDVTHVYHGRNWTWHWCESTRELRRYSRHNDDWGWTVTARLPPTTQSLATVFYNQKNSRRHYLDRPNHMVSRVPGSRPQQQVGRVVIIPIERLAPSVLLLVYNRLAQIPLPSPPRDTSAFMWRVDQHLTNQQCVLVNRVPPRAAARTISPHLHIVPLVDVPEGTVVLAKTTRRHPLDHVIRDIAENPKRRGSASYKRYNLYYHGMTVGEYLDAGGRHMDLAWDEDRGFITITSPG